MAQNIKECRVEGITCPDCAARFEDELLRALFSAVFLLLAFLAKTKGLTFIYIPCFIFAMIVGGFGNFKKAYHSIKRLDFNMNVLMSVAVIGAVAIGELEEGAVVSLLYSISEMLESWTMESARRSLQKLIDMAPKIARVKKPWGEVEVPVDEINTGDIIVVRPGEKVAMDGVIIKGESAINESTITGESIPVEKGPGDEVYAGTINIHGSLEVKVTKPVQDTTLAKIIHLVEEAQAKRAPVQAFVDRFAAVYTPIVLGLAGIITLFPPLLFGFEWQPWIYRGLALLVVSCPCALVISTPIAIVSAISNAARHGVLIKGGVYLEEVGELKVVAFDKTGTLTRGEPVVTDVIPVGAESEEEVLYKAASVEKMSEHPIAHAVVEAAQNHGINVTSAESFTALAGKGAMGSVKGEVILIGSVKLFEEKGVDTSGIIQDLKRLQEEGKTTILVGTETDILGIIAVADEIRDSSKKAVTLLKSEGIEKTIILTGDNEATARAISRRSGVDDYFAELLPQDKVNVLEKLIKKYGKVAMVGDGINDAPALAAATVGIAMGGTGTDVALETADIVLMNDDLTKVAFTIRLSKNAKRVIRQNITLSLFFKIAAVLATFPGWLTLWLAIVADMGASLLVTLNGMRLLKNRA
ncbi:cadmium-translocating P-type ATPase [Thermovorax subterraneus]|nr:cadmium-translocating P-type ATPase [Thermovorax subterraneus]